MHVRPIPLTCRNKLGSAGRNLLLFLSDFYICNSCFQGKIVSFLGHNVNKITIKSIYHEDLKHVGKTTVYLRHCFSYSGIFIKLCPELSYKVWVGKYINMYF